MVTEIDIDDLNKMQRQITDLAMIVQRLVYHLKMVNNTSLSSVRVANNAADYLRRHDLDQYAI